MSLVPTKILQIASGAFEGRRPKSLVPPKMAMGLGNTVVGNIFSFDQTGDLGYLIILNFDPQPNML